MGACQHEPAGDLHAGGPDAARRLAAASSLGCGTDTWKYWAELRAGNIDRGGMAGHRGRHRALAGPLHDDGHGVDDDVRGRGAGLHAARAPRRSPRADSRHARMAADTGRRIVEMVWEDLKPRDFVDRAQRSTTPITTVLALGGSTNAIVHLVAMARRAGVRARRSTASTRSRGARRCSPTSGRRAST